MKKIMIATAFSDSRSGQLYLRPAVPKALRAAFDGKAVHEVSLRTKGPSAAKVAFARRNAAFEARLTDARRRVAEDSVLPTPAALVRRWCQGPAIGKGLSGQQRLIATFMELDAATGGRSSRADPDLCTPAILGPALNTDWSSIHADSERFEALQAEAYDGEV